MKWIYLGLAIVFEIIATSSLRQTDGFTKWLPSLLTICGYCASFYFLSLSLRTIPVGIAYAIWSAVGMVMIALIGYVLFGQKLDLAAIVGIGLIIAGVISLSLFSNSVSLHV